MLVRDPAAAIVQEVRQASVRCDCLRKIKGKLKSGGGAKIRQMADFPCMRVELVEVVSRVGLAFCRRLARHRDYFRFIIREVGKIIYMPLSLLYTYFQ